MYMSPGTHLEPTAERVLGADHHGPRPVPLPGLRAAHDPVSRVCTTRVLKGSLGGGGGGNGALSGGGGHRSLCGGGGGRGHIWVLAAQGEVKT